MCAKTRCVSTFCELITPSIFEVFIREIKKSSLCELISSLINSSNIP